MAEDLHKDMAEEVHRRQEALKKMEQEAQPIKRDVFFRPPVTSVMDLKIKIIIDTLEELLYLCDGDHVLKEDREDAIAKIRKNIRSLKINS